MDTSDKPLSDFVGIFKSWIPRRSEPGNLSRDFWMPDHICRVCYDCETPFTIFNRKHHCRLCGRVFCAKCTSNSIPIFSSTKHVKDDNERIRVCNFCFKQCQQDAGNKLQPSSPCMIVRSPSEASCSSTKSGGTVNGSFVTVGSAPYTSGSYRVPYGSSRSLSQYIPAESSADQQSTVTPRRSVDSVKSARDPCISQFGCHDNRSDDEDDKYGACSSDLETVFNHSDDNYSQVGEGQCCLQNDYPTEENNDEKENHSSANGLADLHNSLGVDKLADETGTENSYEGGSSSIFGMESTAQEPVDFENNGLLWLPPEPEDEEDDNDDALLEEDEYAVGEWGCLRSSNSFGKEDEQSRDRSSEEHKKVMKNIVDGHFRALIAQLLQVEGIPVSEDDEKGSWLDIITSLSWEAANFLRPDTSKGGGMDPGGYVKIKCIACGHPSQSMVVKGVVCKKNIANRRMNSKIDKPRFLILGGALEYQRVTNLLSSFDTLLQQEADHLKVAVDKIESQHPDVLLVEKTVARSAQDCLLAKNISLVLNIRRPLLERIARCTGSQIVPSVDHLPSQKLGHCDFFRVEKFFEEHGSAREEGKMMTKTLMFFEGCPKPLGCTVLLKGAKGDELKKVKHVIQYGVFAAYHLAMETSFLADEGASLPELALNSPLSVGLPTEQSNIERSISTIPDFAPSAEKPKCYSAAMECHTHDSSSISCNSTQKKMTASPSFSFRRGEFVSTLKMSNHTNHATEPHFRTHLSSVQMFDAASNASPRHSPRSMTKSKTRVGFMDHYEQGKLSTSFEAVTESPVVSDRAPDSMKTPGSLRDFPGVTEAASSLTEEQYATSSLVASYERNDSRKERKPSKEEFQPSSSDYQSILVSLSTRCVWKGTVCERTQLLRIKYYGSFDKPLGRFLRDHLFDQGYQCRSCEMPSEAHVHCYTHRQGTLTISVRKLPEFLLPGERDGKIWMWHRCLRCPRTNGFPPATRRIVMSDAAWGLSFGKFLELSFSNNAAASRVASCGHSLHRDCLRFYGCGKMVACFRYDSINVYCVKLPPSTLDFSYVLLEWIQKEANEVADRSNLLFCEVLNALCQVAERRHTTGPSNSSSQLGNSNSCILELQAILQKEKAEFEESLQKVVKTEVTRRQPVIDILELNKLRRQLIFQSYLWDQRLICAAGSDTCPHEVISGFLAREKDKDSSIDKASEANKFPKPEQERGLSRDIPSDPSVIEHLLGKALPVNKQEQPVEDPNRLIIRQQQRDIKLCSFQREEERSNLVTCTSACEQLEPMETGYIIRRALSDGQFPMTTELSDTLDAKWIGDSDLPLVDANSASMEASTAPSSQEDSDERTISESGQSSKYTFSSMLGDSAEDFLSWISTPFLNFYRSFNKNWGSAPRFGALSAYNPVYITLFQEIERQNGARLLLPVGINDTVIPVYDREPTSIISYALVSTEYHFQISDERDRTKDSFDSSVSFPLHDSGSSFLSQSTDECSGQFRSLGSTEDCTLSSSGTKGTFTLDPVNYAKSIHVRVSFVDEGLLGRVKHTVTCYYAKQFDSLRRTCCPSELDFVRSLSRCKKWGAQGGKSNVFFAKTLDERFIVKQVTKTELDSFLKFAPEYFKYLSDSIGSGSPTCLAKILGIYQVTSKNLKGGKEIKMDVLVMENLLFGRVVSKLYDLKGSSRSRYNPDSSGSNKVLLDQNLIEAMPTSPIFVGNKAKRLLERAVWNDTSFLASIDVMDYSLLVGVDEEKHELVLGIIDFMRQYTWDKHLETWVKASGILGGSKNASPTVISPQQYKKRFRKAMSTYFLMVPDQWSPPSNIINKLQPELNEEDASGMSLQS